MRAEGSTASTDDNEAHQLLGISLQQVRDAAAAAEL